MRYSARNPADRLPAEPQPQAEGSPPVADRDGPTADPGKPASPPDSAAPPGSGRASERS